MIELKDVIKKIDEKYIIKNISFKIDDGSSFALIGANGAGKSTILRLISGIYSHDGGSVTIDGEEVFDNPNAKQKIFFINDETTQFTGFTLIQLKNFYKNFYLDFSEEIFSELVTRLNLPINRKLSTYSKGMKRQAITAVGLACNTKYLLMDESFDGLDPAMRNIIKKIIFEAMETRNVTLIISSHNLKEINELCDKCIIIHNGELISQGNTDSSDPNMFKIQLAFKDKNIIIKPEQFNKFKIIHVSQLMSVYTVIAKGNQEEIKNHFKQLNPILMDFIPLTLEETFIYEMEERKYVK